MKIFVWPDRDWMLEEDLGDFPCLMDIKSDDYVTINVPDNLTIDQIDEYVLKTEI